MKIHSTILYIGISMVLALPALSHAQTTLPSWMQPSWLNAKLTDFPSSTTSRHEVTRVTQTNELTNNGSTNMQINQQTNRQVSSQILPKQNVGLAPVETAVPKLNEKYLTPEELKELRRQLRQQR